MGALRGVRGRVMGHAERTMEVDVPLAGLFTSSSFGLLEKTSKLVLSDRALSRFVLFAEPIYQVGSANQGLKSTQRYHTTIARNFPS